MRRIISIAFLCIIFQITPINAHAETSYFHELKNLADQGNAEAQRRLGIAYANGSGGIQKNNESAMHWLTKAALNDDNEAQLYLAAQYYKGEIVEKSTYMSYAWASISADGGNANAIRIRNALSRTMSRQELDMAKAVTRSVRLHMMGTK